LEDVFESDWNGTTVRPEKPYAFPSSLKLVASPRGHLPDESLWDLPALVHLIDSAKRSVRVQLLTYGGVDALDEALVRAAARGVEVTLLVSDWELRPRNIKGLHALTALDSRVQARIFTVPQAKSGFIPFARVAHAKYCVVDGERGWVGTGNWEPDYFEKSRNVGLLLEGGQIPVELEAFFLRNWRSPYAAPFERDRDYTPPRISRGER
jgi:phosphatidylserine/phosphatidylglycerophosphate/cardiolipin synthase-like enzyme